MADKPNDGAPTPAPEVTPAAISKAVSDILKAVDGFPPIAQRKALLGSAGILGLDLRTQATAAPRQQQQQQRRG